MRSRPSGDGHVLFKMFQAFNEVGAVAGQRGAQDFRIGNRKIGRRKRIENLLHIKFRLLARMVVQPIGVLDEVLRPVGRDQVELLEKIKNRVLLPVPVLEALVIARRAGHGFGWGAKRLRPGILPKLAVAVPKLGLGFHQLLRLGQIGLGHGAKRLGHLVDGGDLGFRLLLGQFRALGDLPGNLRRTAQKRVPGSGRAGPGPSA